MLTTWTSRNANTKTQMWSCQGKSRFDSFQVDLFVGWLRMRPRETWNVSSRNVTIPPARATSQYLELGLPVGCRRRDVVAGVDGDDREDREQDDRPPAGQSIRRARTARRGRDAVCHWRPQMQARFTYLIETPSAKKVSLPPAVASRSSDRAGPDREEVDRHDATERRQRRPSGTGPSDAPRAAARRPRRTGRTRRRPRARRRGPGRER